MQSYCIDMQPCRPWPAASALCIYCGSSPTVTLTPNDLLLNSGSEAMAAPEAQASSLTPVQDGDKVISELPTQLFGNSDDAKEEFDGTAGK